MMLRGADDLRAHGFCGFIGFSQIRSRPEDVPAEQGVYAVVAPTGFANDYLVVGTGGHFKGINPNVSVATLRGNWIPGSLVLYFGLAGPGATGRRGLRKRLFEFAAFGDGRPVGHKGGRLIWQLRNSAQLLVCWKATEANPAEEEGMLLRSFFEEYRALPFANLRF
jgi:hypothetical protein